MLHKELWTPFLNDYEKHNLPFPFDWKMRPNEMTKMVGDVESGEVQCPYGDYSNGVSGVCFYHARGTTFCQFRSLTSQN
jgi:hypothetical protein